MGVARKRDVGGYSKLMDKAAKCLHRLFELAASKKRNYILDQVRLLHTRRLFSNYKNVRGYLHVVSEPPQAGVISAGIFCS